MSESTENPATEHTADTSTDSSTDLLSCPIGAALVRDILEPLKADFVGKDEIIDVMGVCLAGGENLFLLGPPGTAKSALVMGLAARLDGRVFDYLLTRFTEPNELFGPFDIRKLREGDLVTNTEGMLPEASFVFLDELLNANSAILNSLLMVLNERVFRRGRETRSLPTLMVVGASNGLPEDEALAALFDRFLLRVVCDNVPDDRLEDVLLAGWKLDQKSERPQGTFTVGDAKSLQQQVTDVDLSGILKPYSSTLLKLREAGIPVSDRRAVRLLRLVSASALLAGRTEAILSDLWILRYIWETTDQQEVLSSIVSEAVKGAELEAGPHHPRALQTDRVDAERLHQELLAIIAELDTEAVSEVERARLRDRTARLAERADWVENETRRDWLTSQIESLWSRFEDAATD